MKTCEYCQTPGKYIAVEHFGDTRLFLSVSGEYLQIFDEEYPGRITNIKINNCPMCGRPLRAEEIIIKTNRVLRGLLLPPLPPGEYPAGCNKNGAVHVKLPEGKTLGVKPGEFEFIKAPTLRKKGRGAGVSAGAPAAAPLTKEPDINPAAGAACININFEEDLARELEKELSAGNVLTGIMRGGA